MGTTADRFSHPLLQILPGSLTIYIHAQQLHKHTHINTYTNMQKHALNKHGVTEHAHKHTPQRHTHIPINTLINTQSHPVLKHYRFSPGEVFVFGWSIKPHWHYNFRHTKPINTIGSIQICTSFVFSDVIRTNDRKNALKNTLMPAFSHFIVQACDYYSQ